MRTGLLVTLLPLLLGGVFLIVLDVWLFGRGGYQATISYEVLQASRTHPVIPLLVGLVTGLLFGHLFWSQ
jgi:hypothetical protein